MLESAIKDGVIAAVRGSVVDAYFPDHLPHMFSVLTAGQDASSVIEVVSHISSDTVRGVALTATRGLERGGYIVDTGRPLSVPVGQRVLGRMFDVFGNTIDRKTPITGGEWRSILAPRVPLVRRMATSEVFHTGLKIISPASFPEPSRSPCVCSAMS
jgi:F-type H+-transporting ATPase subunit beta